MNLHHLFAIRKRKRPEAPAVTDPLRRDALSYRELFRAADTAAAGLADRGLGRGDRVALLADTSPELVVAHLALLRLGAVAVPVNLAYRGREVEHLLGDAAPKLVVAGQEQAELVRRVLERMEIPGERAGVEEVVPVGELGRAIGSEAEAAPADEPELPQEPDGSDPALLVYTSGTTGKSKGAVLTHDNLLATITGLLAAWAWRPSDRLLLALPLFHVHGLVVGLLTALAAGASVELHRRFDAAVVVDRLNAGNGRGSDTGDSPTLFFGVPTMYVRLLRELRRRQEAGRPADLSRVRLFASGSAPLAPETFEGFRRAAGHEILERYGMSETGMNLSNPYAGPRLPGTVGVPLPGVSIRIVDPDRLPDAGGPADLEPLPDGEAGELLVRGSNVFAGYRGDPEKTAASFVTEASPEGGGWAGSEQRSDRRPGALIPGGASPTLRFPAGEAVPESERSRDRGGTPADVPAGTTGRPRVWFRTGDLARRDPATGYLTLLGRRHDLILRGGLNVYPREVEEVLEAQPGVREAAVAGRPDPEYGQVPVAYVVPEEGAETDAERLLARCREELAPFKVPAEVRFLDELPRNALGKVQKHRLPG